MKMSLALGAADAGVDEVAMATGALADEVPAGALPAEVVADGAPAPVAPAGVAPGDAVLGAAAGDEAGDDVGDVADDAAGLAELQAVSRSAARARPDPAMIRMDFMIPLRDGCTPYCPG
jgi:hypothetical protein